MSIEDEFAIRNLLAKTALAADEGTLDEYLGFFTEDGVFDVMGAAREGREAMRAGTEGGRTSGNVGPGSHTIHVLAASDVQVNGDEATALSSFVFYRDTHETPVANLVGRYHDRLRRTDGGWKLAYRRVQIGS